MRCLCAFLDVCLTSVSEASLLPLGPVRELTYSLQFPPRIAIAKPRPSPPPSLASATFFISSRTPSPPQSKASHSTSLLVEPFTLHAQSQSLVTLTLTDRAHRDLSGERGVHVRRWQRARMPRDRFFARLAAKPLPSTLSSAGSNAQKRRPATANSLTFRRGLTLATCRASRSSVRE